VTGATPPVLAAGALCWRIVNGKLRVLVIYRGDRADTSLPKGKVDPGESLPQTAVREIAEETGLAIVLGAPLGTVDYQLPNGRDKVVYYWAAEVSDEAIAASTFVGNAEVASLAWVSMKKARATLSYPHDLAVLDRFEKRLEEHNARTFAIIALRHGKAVPPEMWDGPDATRPLMQRGHDQAVAIAPGIAAYGPRKLISSTAARCLATIEPLAQLLDRKVTATAAISQDAHEYNQSDVGSVLLKRLASKKTAVLCSHGPVLPEIIAEVARLSGATQQPALRGAAALSTGEYTVLHLSVENPTGGIVAIETHGPASA
jgi:8-oxo-dGTP diphosphatase